jgi:hypothetical protein
MITKEGSETVQYPLKDYYDKSRLTEVRFAFGTRTELAITTSLGAPAYTLLRGEDPENHAFLFRLTPTDAATQLARESVVVFNRDHRIEMSAVLLPGRAGASQRKEPAVRFKAVIKRAQRFDPETDDPVLYFLRSRIPESRYIASSGPDNGFPNERDVVANTAHMRAATREMAQLLWVYEGLCSVVASMSMPAVVAAASRPAKLPPLDRRPKEPPTDLDMDGLTKQLAGLPALTANRSTAKKSINYDTFIKWLCDGPDIKWDACINSIHNFVSSGINSDQKTDMKFLSTSHDDVLQQIATMARLSTDVFKKKIDGHANGLAALTSPHNGAIAVASADLNTLPYFGYKMTQWLLSSVELQKPTLRAGVKYVECQFSTSGLKSTYMTDVLMAVSRKAYIDPWHEMFGSDASAWPPWLTSYSIGKHFNLGWATPGTIVDKQVSVKLNTTYKVRFVCEAFRRSFEGADPMEARRPGVEASLAGVSVNRRFLDANRRFKLEPAALGIKRGGGIDKKPRKAAPHRAKPAKVLAARSV